MTATPHGQGRDVLVLQAPGEASLVAWTQNLFLRALHDPKHGLPRAAYHELATLQPAARHVIATAPVPGPCDEEGVHRMMWVSAFMRPDGPEFAPWRTWAEQWRIPAPCVIQWAFLACAHDRPPEPGFAHLQFFIGATPADVPGAALTVTATGHLLRDTEDEFIARARIAYGHAYKRLRGTHGFAPLHPHPQLANHCAWTVARYVHERSTISIGSAAAVTDRAVRKAIRTVATRVRLPELTKPSP